MEKLICLSNTVWWQSTCSYVDASVWRVDGVGQRGFVRVFGRVGGGKTMVARAWSDRSGGVGSFVGGDSAVARVGGAAVMASDAMMVRVGGSTVMASDAIVVMDVEQRRRGFVPLSAVDTARKNPCVRRR